MAGEIISKLEARSMKYMNIESQHREKNNWRKIEHSNIYEKSGEYPETREERECGRKNRNNYVQNLPKFNEHKIYKFKI